MMGSRKILAGDATAAPPAGDLESLRRRMQILPRPLRFLCVGAVGLMTDLSVFTAIPLHAQHPLVARVASLAIATFVTWRLNRALTFAASGRQLHHEALRYAGVTVLSQGTSFTVFSILVLTVSARIPQLALIAGAAAGAVVAYTGHLLFAFRPAVRASSSDPTETRS